MLKCVRVSNLLKYCRPVRTTDKNTFSDRTSGFKMKYRQVSNEKKPSDISVRSARRDHEDMASAGVGGVLEISLTDPTSAACSLRHQNLSVRANQLKVQRHTCRRFYQIQYEWKTSKSRLTEFHGVTHKLLHFELHAKTRKISKQI